MQFEFASFVAGVLVGSIAAAAIAIPRVGRILARLASVILFISGIGFLTLGITSMVTSNQLTPISWQQLTIATPIEATGLGGGLLVGGILALVLSFVSRNE